jgi:hypothetical protein
MYYLTRMEQVIAVSMRTNTGSAKKVLKQIASNGVRCVQLDALHDDFVDMTESGLRDVAATMRGLGVRACGVDFLVSPEMWEEAPERTLDAFSRAVAIAEVVGNVPVGTRMAKESEITESAISIGQQSGVLLSSHGTNPPQDPQVGWHLPLALLSKEENPLLALVKANHAPLAIRLRGEIVDETSLEYEGTRMVLRELRGVLDAMRWNPMAILDCDCDDTLSFVKAWQVAGP